MLDLTNLEKARRQFKKTLLCCEVEPDSQVGWAKAQRCPPFPYPTHTSSSEWWANKKTFAHPTGLGIISFS